MEIAKANGYIKSKIGTHVNIKQIGRNKSDLKEL